MGYRKLSVLCAILAPVLLLAAAALGAMWTFENFIFSEWHFYPANLRVLDLRDEQLTIEAYRDISAQLPDTTVLWKVPFQGRYLEYDTREIQIFKLRNEDLKPLRYMPWLETVHAEECTDYPQLAALQKELPNCRVLYTVTIDGRQYEQDTTEIEVSNLSRDQVERLAYLPRLSSVNATGSYDHELLRQTQIQHPEWNLVYAVVLGGQEVSTDASQLTVENATIDELRKGLPGLSQLEQLVLVNPDASRDELEQLREEYPDVTMLWYYLLLGKRINMNAEELDLSDVPLEDLEAVEKVVSRMPYLEKLILSAGKVTNQELSAFREVHRNNFDVSWTGVPVQ